MGDYFKKWVAQLEKNRSTEFWLPLAALEEVRVFPQNPMAENLATSIRALENEIYELDRQENVSGIDQLRKSQEVYLEDYTSAFKADEGRMGANLEKVLTLLDAMQGFDAEDARGRLLMSIWRLFRELDQLVGKNEWPHSHLAKLLKDRKDVSTTFVSFNYDLWIETSLQRQGVWHPATGYGHRFSRIAPHPSATQTGSWGHYDVKPFADSPASKILVLKPNGSLSWFSSLDVQDVVLMVKDDVDDIAYNSDYYLDRVNLGKNLGKTLIPLVVPPIHSATRREPVLWAIDQQIQACLREADVLVIIGWSLPETDQKFATDFQRAIQARTSQLPCLVLCDPALSRDDTRSVLIKKFEGLFRPVKRAITREMVKEDGFTKGFVDFLETIINDCLAK